MQASPGWGLERRSFPLRSLSYGRQAELPVPIAFLLNEVLPEACRA